MPIQRDVDLQIIGRLKALGAELGAIAAVAAFWALALAEPATAGRLYVTDICSDEAFAGWYVANCERSELVEEHAAQSAKLIKEHNLTRDGECGGALRKVGELIAADVKRKGKDYVCHKLVRGMVQLEKLSDATHTDVNKRFHECAEEACRASVLADFRSDMWDEFKRWRALWTARNDTSAERLVGRAMADNDHYYRHTREAVKAPDPAAGRDYEEAWACRQATIYIKYALAGLANHGQSDEPASVIAEEIKKCTEAHMAAPR